MGSNQFTQTACGIMQEMIGERRETMPCSGRRGIILIPPAHACAYCSQTGIKMITLRLSKA